jgi:hypothetical protein
MGRRPSMHDAPSGHCPCARRTVTTQPGFWFRVLEGPPARIVAGWRGHESGVPSTQADHPRLRLLAPGPAPPAGLGARRERCPHYPFVARFFWSCL